METSIESVVETDDGNVEFLVNDKDEQLAVLKQDYFDKPRFIISAWLSYNIYEFDSWIIVFEAMKRTEYKTLKEKVTWEDICEVGYWHGKADLSHIIFNLKKLFKLYKDKTELGIKIGIGMNDYGKALIDSIERAEKEIKYRLYQEPNVDKKGIPFDNPKGLLEDLRRMLPKKISPLHIHKTEAILKEIRIVGVEVEVPKKHEAYIWALAGASRMVGIPRPVIPSSAPTSNRIY